MKKLFSLALALSVGAAVFAQEKKDATLNIVPLPQQVQIKNGTFKINPNTKIAFDNEEDKKVATLFQDFLKSNYNLNLSLVKSASSNSIYFSSKNAKSTHAEAYELNISSDRATVSGKAAGLFYGMQSLIQLLPVDKKASIEIQQASIQDEPRFAYRGLHLDVGRHFFPVEFVKKYIDILASYKLNTFHWHLTDDQGWRIEIKSHPKLTQIGGYRKQTLLGNYKTDGDYDNTPYGGFYTQDQIKEVVAYAKAKYVTVIPEIEMPGHALAALSAYPELGCGDKPGPYTAAQTWGVFDDVFCAGKEETFKLLEDVIDEVIPLFPSEYIHIGGDECPKTKWKTCPFCQKRIKDNNLKDEHELQSYFIQRMEKYINSKGKRIIGWDEILEGGLAPNATVMSWRGDQGAIDAANQGHDVIITANSYGLYFDHKQGPDQNREPLSIGGLSTLSKVYASDTMPSKIAENNKKHVLGVQANIWTEYIGSSNKVEFTVLPRVLALSEIAWTQPEKKNWKNFSEQRAANQLAKLDQTNTFYRVPEVYGITDSTVYASEYTIRGLKPSVEGAKIYYTLDNYDPSELDLEYTGPVKITVPNGRERIFKAVVVTPSGKRSNYIRVNIINTKK